MTEAAGEGQAADGEAAEIRGREMEDEGIQNQTMKTIAERKAFARTRVFFRGRRTRGRRDVREREQGGFPACFSRWMFSLVGL